MTEMTEPFAHNAALASGLQHYLVLPLAGWGHLRPLLHFTFNLCTVHPSLQITLLVDPVMSPRIVQELAEHPHPPSVLDRIQIIEIVEVNNTDIVDDLKASGKETMPIYLKALFQGGGPEIETKFGPPTLAVFDWFQGGFIGNLKSVTAELGIPIIPAVVFTSMQASGLCRFWMPAEKGGFIDKWNRETEKLLAQGVEKYEAFERTWFHCDDEVIHPPGMAPMQEWEFFPQVPAIAMTPHWDEMLLNCRLVAFEPEVTGVVITATREIDGEALAALEPVLGKKVFAVGPQFGKEVWEGKKPDLSAITPDDGIALGLLDEQLRLNGPRSVAYISFGSLFWPVKRPELVKYLVDCLPPNMTVLLSDASAMTTLSAQMKASIEKRGKVVKFAPQWKVLNHPAVGMVVSHLGANSMLEVILSGNPVIAFPFSGDQSDASQILSDKLKIAIELQQIRSGVDGKTRYNGVVINSTEENIKAEMREAFARITGPEGEEMRKRIQAIRAEYAKSWKEGKSLVAMEEFGRFAVA